MYSNEHTLQDLLMKAYHRLDMDDVVDEMKVCDTYKRVVGDLISRLTWKVSFKEGVLKVQLASPALKHELWHRRESLAEKINEAIGRKAVKKIVFV